MFQSRSHLNLASTFLLMIKHALVYLYSPNDHAIENSNAAQKASTLPLQRELLTRKTIACNRNRCWGWSVALADPQCSFCVCMRAHIYKTITTLSCLRHVSGCGIFILNSFWTYWGHFPLVFTTLREKGRVSGGSNCPLSGRQRLHECGLWVARAQ